MMKKLLVLSLISSIFYSCKNDKIVNKHIPINAEEESNIEQTKVLTLGSFHFTFPNLDINKTNKKGQINVLDTKYQKEIELIVNKLAKFKPTKIVIERHPKKQQTYDSLYISFLKGKHKLSGSEEQQIGFRLAKLLGINKLHCTDAWGSDYEDVKKIVNGSDSIGKEKFLYYFFNNPDSILKPLRRKSFFKTKGILAELKRLNSAEYIKKGLGSYLIGIFKYETKGYQQFGPDYVTSWWFNRNLRIFRNIQRVRTNPKDRILVIYGAGHMNLLNIFFDASPEYKLLHVNDYLN
jgi:hypothetical protein